MSLAQELSRCERVLAESTRAVIPTTRPISGGTRNLHATDNRQLAMSCGRCSMSRNCKRSDSSRTTSFTKSSEMRRIGGLIDMELLETIARMPERYQTFDNEIQPRSLYSFEHTASGWNRLFEKYGMPATVAFARRNCHPAIDHRRSRKRTCGQLASLNSKTFAALQKLIGAMASPIDINQLRGDDGGGVRRFSLISIRAAGCRTTTINTSPPSARMFLGGWGSFRPRARISRPMRCKSSIGSSRISPTTRRYRGVP